VPVHPSAAPPHVMGCMREFGRKQQYGTGISGTGKMNPKNERKLACNAVSEMRHFGNSIWNVSVTSHCSSFAVLFV
jgi:hypothetical protein